MKVCRVCGCRGRARQGARGKGRAEGCKGWSAAAVGCKEQGGSRFGGGG